MKRLMMCLIIGTLLIDNCLSQEKNDKSISVKEATDAINYCILKITIDQLNTSSFTGKRVHKDIIVNQAHPLKIELSNNPNAFEKQEAFENRLPKIDGAPGTIRAIQLKDTVKDILVSGKIKILVGPFIQMGIAGGQVKINGAKVDYSETTAFLDSGTISFTGSYKTNTTDIEFENGSVMYYEKNKAGIFGEGTTCRFNGVKYVYSNHEWLNQ